jgi:hypothetical protein
LYSLTTEEASRRGKEACFARLDGVMKNLSSAGNVAAEFSESVLQRRNGWIYDHKC